VHRPGIVIVTPALADANNGNWQTARRWARMLSPAYRVTLTKEWPPQPVAHSDAVLMIALHARRSAASVVAWQASRPKRPLVVVLTGTDLYRDIEHDAAAQRSLALADRLLVLNRLGRESLPVEHRGKAEVVLQSCRERQALAKPTRHLRVLMVGHLREEKDPQTYLRAAARLRERQDIHFEHVGAPLDPALAAAALALQAEHPRYRWLGALPHTATRLRIQRAHVLVHASRMEGGAHVVIEALRSGTGVIASHIDGNVGLLTARHPALFAVGDDAGLCRLIERCRDETTMLPRLVAAGARLAERHSPEAEAARLHQVVARLLR
jgi:putative glycosyltransferase (TIGR04348 family)